MSAHTTTDDPKKNKRVTAERAVTLISAGIASAVAAQGMYMFFHDELSMPTPLLITCFSFIELMVVASAMRARRSQIDTGSAGIDGIAMWVLTIMSGILAATHAATPGETLLRLLAPLVAAWGWERSMALERRQLTGHDGGMNWRISPQRLLVKWGIADPTSRTTADIAVERRLADVARAAHALHVARDNNRSDRHIQRRVDRLYRAADKAAEDGLVLGDPQLQDQLRTHLEGRFSVLSLADYVPATRWAVPPVGAPDPAPLTPGPGPGGGEDIDAELAQLTAATLHTTPAALPRGEGASAPSAAVPAEGVQVHPAVHVESAPLHPAVRMQGALVADETVGEAAADFVVQPSAVSAELEVHPPTVQGASALVSGAPSAGAPKRAARPKDTSSPNRGSAGVEAGAGVHPAAPQVRMLAEELVRQHLTTKSFDDVVQVLDLAAHGTKPTTIAAKTGIHHKTVSKLLASAEHLRPPRRAANGGGKVIELDRRTTR